MITKEIKIQFYDGKNCYRVYLVKKIFQKPKAYVGRFVDEKEVSGTAIKATVSASTLKEIIGNWLWGLKRYFADKRKKEEWLVLIKRK